MKAFRGHHSHHYSFCLSGGPGFWINIVLGDQGGHKEPAALWEEPGREAGTPGSVGGTAQVSSRHRPPGTAECW